MILSLLYPTSFVIATMTGREPCRFGVILDLYHAQLLTGDAAEVLARFYDRTVHVQIADNPGRHEPGTGTLDFRGLFAALEQRGYPGWIGCEYRPSGSTVASLGWIKQLSAQVLYDHT